MVDILIYKGREELEVRSSCLEHRYTRLLEVRCGRRSASKHRVALSGVQVNGLCEGLMQSVMQGQPIPAGIVMTQHVSGQV